MVYGELEEAKNYLLTQLEENNLNRDDVFNLDIGKYTVGGLLDLFDDDNAYDGDGDEDEYKYQDEYQDEYKEDEDEDYGDDDDEL